MGAFFESRGSHIGFVDIVEGISVAHVGERSDIRIMGTESETATSGGIRGRRETMRAIFFWKTSLKAPEKPEGGRKVGRE